jgi:hypothetical protein
MPARRAAWTLPPAAGTIVFSGISRGAFIMKKLLLKLMLSLPLVLGVAAAVTVSVTAIYANPPDPKPK